MARTKFNPIVPAQAIIDFASDDSKVQFLKSEPVIRDALAMARLTVGQTISYDREQSLLAKGYFNGKKRTPKGDWLLKTFSNMEFLFELWIGKYMRNIQEDSANFLRKIASEYTDDKPYTADDRQDNMDIINELVGLGFLNRRSTGFSGHLHAIWITNLGKAWAQNAKT